MDGTASGLSACHQHDILSRQAMMYLLTRGWSSAHTSLAMTPEHSDMSAEYCCRKPSRAEHSRSTPADVKGEGIPSPGKCVAIPLAQLPQVECRAASVMLSLRMSKCKLPTGMFESRRMNSSTWDHQVWSQGLSANSLKIMAGATLFLR